MFLFKMYLYFDNSGSDIVISISPISVNHLHRHQIFNESYADLLYLSFVSGASCGRRHPGQSEE